MNDLLLKACRREPTSRTPIWLMRQAGRYMPEYRAIRERHGFLTMVKTPELAAEISLQPVRALGVDAAIIFADILPVLESVGLTLTYEQGEGPVIHNPIASAEQAIALQASARRADMRVDMRYTLDAIRLLKRELRDKLPVIGFSGAPFTLAAYAIEGGGSKDFRKVKSFMRREPDAWRALMSGLADIVSGYLIAQIEAGADAVQIFDTWAGQLAPQDYALSALPYVQQVIARVRAAASAPIIYFGTDMHGLSGLVRQTGADVLGVDWRVNLDDAWAALGEVAVQGNLDPTVLFAPPDVLEQRAMEVLDQAGGRAGHIFNLGHGILTETPVDNVKRLVDLVGAYSSKKGMRTGGES